MTLRISETTSIQIFSSSFKITPYSTGQSWADALSFINFANPTLECHARRINALIIHFTVKYRAGLNTDLIAAGRSMLNTIWFKFPNPRLMLGLELGISRDCHWVGISQVPHLTLKSVFQGFHIHHVFVVAPCREVLQGLLRDGLSYVFHLGMCDGNCYSFWFVTKIQV